MPKVTNTRRLRARELLKDATTGPSFSGFDFGGNKKFQEEARQAYRIWSSTWLLPELKRLIPELKEAKHG